MSWPLQPQASRSTSLSMQLDMTVCDGKAVVRSCIGASGSLLMAALLCSNQKTHIGNLLRCVANLLRKGKIIAKQVLSPVEACQGHAAFACSYACRTRTPIMSLLKMALMSMALGVLCTAFWMYITAAADTGASTLHMHPISHHAGTYRICWPPVSAPAPCPLSCKIGVLDLAGAALKVCQSYEAGTPQVNFIPRARIPIMKGVLLQGGRNVDISLGTLNGIQAALYFRAQMLTLAPLRPLALIVKALLKVGAGVGPVSGTVKEHWLMRLDARLCQGHEP